MMRLLLLHSLLFCLAILSPSVARASILWDNGLHVNDANFWSYSCYSETLGTQYQVADFFYLSEGALITGARWTGALVDSNGQYQEIVGESFQFDVLILPDNNGRPSGTPIAPIPGDAIRPQLDYLEGTMPTGSRYGNYVAEYRMPFDPIPLGPGNYWLVVSARGDFAADGVNPGGWLWTGRAGTGYAWQGGSNWQNNWIFQGRQQDFTLFGSVPEPSSVVFWSIIGVSGVGLLVIRRRKINSIS